MPQVLTRQEVLALRAIGDEIDIDEVDDIYLPLSRLLHLRIEAHQALEQATSTFLGTALPHTPFVIGIAGSVAVGKSTTARLLQQLLSRWESHPKVDLITTDGFLYPTAELQARGILQRKGFPESYDRKALLRFLSGVKAGVAPIHAPVYSHLIYDRVPDEFVTVNNPDIVIVEGLNVLQTGSTLMVSDLFDFSIYVDADVADIEGWFLTRMRKLRATAFKNPNSHFAAYADLTDSELEAEGRRIWQEVNLPNLVDNILPTRPRASLILQKGKNHAVSRVLLRKM
ncbi:Pantothenate kinase [Corynebacterium choanae]|uniref:Pantothenate kinase n=2 Tax=Corynebacterium choanae TaxID=1862358 RepID=A0A3G6JAZ4_9CORY|nr:Pantothenate kinase [Corynebacterium choanae]